MLIITNRQIDETNEGNEKTFGDEIAEYENGKQICNYSDGLSNQSGSQ